MLAGGGEHVFCSQVEAMSFKNWNSDLWEMCLLFSWHWEVNDVNSRNSYLLENIRVDC